MINLDEAARIIRQVKAAILADARDGLVPWQVTDFAQLHSYVDADAYLTQAYDPQNQPSTDEITLIKDAVSAWLALGRLAEEQPVLVTWLVTERYALEQTAAEWRDQIGIPAGKPITVDNIPPDYLSEIEEPTFYVRTEARQVDNVELDGRRPHQVAASAGAV